ncbi:MAG: aryl-sulfate sulfotransferase [Chitinophagaceae bacterium]|nr:aryl-sulfate sulfotransferase [Chitinophagaceae bacterium]
MKVFLVLFFLISTSAFAKYQYVSPMPGSTLNAPESQIIIREGSYLDPSSINAERFILEGTKSGYHNFRVAFSDDQKTIVLYPSKPFGFDEKVTVSIMQGLKTLQGYLIDSFTFSFITDRAYTMAEQKQFQQLAAMSREERPLDDAIDFSYNKVEKNPFNPTERQLSGSFTIVNNSNPSPGDIFYDAWNGNFGSALYDGYNIITTDGDSVYASDKASICFDFKLNPNGYLSVFNDAMSCFDVFDSNYVLIDSYYPANGRAIDPHEFTIYADGHAFMTASETHIVNMQVYDPDYFQSASVTTSVIQEFDESKNLIFEWRALDHIVVTESNQNLAFGFIDAIHTNSIDIDVDGNIVASHRHLNQVNKIDRNTGEFIWRLGGVMNEFTFINEPEPFSFQHDARCLDNGNITLWDNGNGHVPPHSSAKEYALDLVNKTATLIWNYNPQTYANTDVYFYGMGSTRRLLNGNTLICGGWDYSSDQSNMWEVTPDKQVVWELALNNAKSLVGYRAVKYNWRPCAPVSDNAIKLKNITDHSVKIIWPDVSNAMLYDIRIRKEGKINWKAKVTAEPRKIVSNLNPATSYEYQLRANCQNGFASDWSPIKAFTTLPLRISQPVEIVSALKMHPNPTSGIINFELETNAECVASISVFDISGRLFFTAEREVIAGEQSLAFDFTNFPAGIYVARFTTLSGSQTLKFVKE